MTLSVLIFAAIPYLDRSRIPGGARYRPVYRAMFYIFCADILVLAYVGAQPVDDLTTLVGRVATLIYFALFTLLPFVAKREERWLLARGRLPQAVLDHMARNGVREARDARD